MTNATMNREFHPGRSLLLGIVAIAAAVLTLGGTVLLPALHAPYDARIAATPRPNAEAAMQIVRLPSVEVVATRTTNTAASGRWTLPAVFRRG
ncbi:MAG TPA: hypothetical protein PLW68_07290 [Casimicrobiaceae bacterium]|nr:hypothetical protein [Casimicrobiaceae bacterium]